MKNVSLLVKAVETASLHYEAILHYIYSALTYEHSYESNLPLFIFLSLSPKHYSGFSPRPLPKLYSCEPGYLLLPILFPLT